MLRTEYDNWKSRHVVLCGDGSADVRKDGRDAVSEGTAETGVTERRAFPLLSTATTAK